MASNDEMNADQRRQLIDNSFDRVQARIVQCSRLESRVRLLEQQLAAREGQVRLLQQQNDALLQALLRQQSRLATGPETTPQHHLQSGLLGLERRLERRMDRRLRRRQSLPAGRPTVAELAVQVEQPQENNPKLINGGQSKSWWLVSLCSAGVGLWGLLQVLWSGLLTPVLIHNGPPAC